VKLFAVSQVLDAEFESHDHEEVYVVPASSGEEAIDILKESHEVEGGPENVYEYEAQEIDLEAKGPQLVYGRYHN
jgi:hypothetical protein